MDPMFMARLDRVRVAYDAPMTISSGYRCETHNKAVGGALRSPHTIGHAVDVVVYGADAVRLLDKAIYCGMKGIGIAQRGPQGARFIHLDDCQFSPSRSRPWIWSY